MRVHEQRRKQTIKRVALGALAMVLVALLGAAVWGYFFMRSVGAEIQTSEGARSELAEVVERPKPKEPFVILLLGSDVRPGDEVARADTIMVARVDMEQKQVSMLSIPRDTRVDIAGHGVAKINSAVAKGGPEGGPALMVRTVEDFLGIDVNYYMEIDFFGLQDIVDAMGGIWIDVDAEIDDWNAASHTPNHEAKYIAEGYQLLDGAHALTYVRSRDFPDADFTRMRHQQEFFRALAKQAGDMGNVLKIPSIVSELAGSITTNMEVGDLVYTAQTLRGMSPDDIYTATVMGEWRSPYVWTDEDLKEELVEIFLTGRSFEEEIVPPEPLDPSTISVAIRNGAGIAGSAGGAASILADMGYMIDEVGNANQFVYDETLIIYKDQSAAAAQVSAELPQGKVVSSRGMYIFDTDILVVVGKDWTGSTQTWDE